MSPPSHHNPQPHDAMSSTRLDLPVLPDPAMRGGRGHRHSSSWLLLAALSIPSLTAVAQEPPQIDATRSATPALPGGDDAAFVENVGQWHPTALAMARAPGVDVWIAKDGLTFDHHRRRGPTEAIEGEPHRDTAILSAEQGPCPAPASRERGTREGHVVRFAFVGGQSRAVVGELPDTACSHFLRTRGSSSSSMQPATARHYRRLSAASVWPGIGLVLHLTDGGPRYDIVV